MGSQTGELIMNTKAKQWVVILFNSLSVLAVLFSIIFFFRMDEESSKHKRFVEKGVVSRAVIMEKNLDKATYQGSRGKSRSVKLNVIRVRHVQKSLVKYADFPMKVQESELPKAPPPSGNSTIEMDYSGIMFVTDELYSRAKVGDVLTVVNTPYEPQAPVLIADVRAYSPNAFYPGIGLSLLLAVCFWFVGRRFKT
jgi:hypothetical protein